MAKRGRPKKTANVPETETVKVKRPYTIAPVVVDPGIPCPHCKCKEGHKHRPGRSPVHLPWGSRNYMICGGCGKAFVKLVFKTK